MIVALNNNRIGTVVKLNEKLNISHYLFLLFWIMKPFYFTESGSMQISDFIFMLSFLVWIIYQRGKIVLDKKDLYLVGFVFCTLIINGIYAAVYADIWFLRSTAFYVYNILIVMIIREFIKSKLFLKSLLWASAFNLLLQLGVLIMGTGRYLWMGFRFMGTFNDPNQFAFSMFTSFLVVYILSSYFKDLEKNRKKLLVLFLFGLALYFVVQGSSTGMLLGTGTFTLLFVITFINSENTAAFMLLRVFAITLFAALIVYALQSGISTVNIDGSVSSGSFLLFRLFEKFDKVEGGGFMALIKDRGLDKLVQYPMYLIFGAGEGGFQRYPGSLYEVHSTLPGMLFYYGIIPFMIFFKWLKFNFKGTSRIVIPAYLALLIESLTLANQRQPVLWVIIVLASLEYANPHELRNYRIVTKL